LFSQSSVFSFSVHENPNYFKGLFSGGDSSHFNSYIAGIQKIRRTSTARVQRTMIIKITKTNRKRKTVP